MRRVAGKSIGCGSWSPFNYSAHGCDVMKFKLNRKTGYWLTEASFKGCDISIAIDKSYPKEELSRRTKDAVHRVRERWGDIQDNIVDALLETHNDSWADPDEGFPELTREGFLSKVVLSQIQLMEEDSLTLYFTDSDIFGGHLVDVFWTTETMYPATLAG